MSKRPPKRLFAQPEPKKVLPRALPPIDRPETPRESRSTMSSHSGRSSRPALAALADTSAVNSSALQEAQQLLSTSKTPEEAAAAIQSFEETCHRIAQAGEFSSADLATYQQITPLLLPLLTNTPGGVLIRIVRGIEYLLEVANVSKPSQARSPRHALVNGNSIKGSRVPRLTPLAPLKESITPKENQSPNEHFYEFIAKTLYKISGSRENDPIFDCDSVIAQLISLTGQSHRIGARTYAVAAMRNEASSTNFRTRLASSENFDDLITALSLPAEKVEFFVHLTGLFRNLIADVSYLDLLVQHRIHLLLFVAMDGYPESPELAFNCFRVLTKLSDRDAVRREMLDRYSANGLLSRFLMLIEKHKGNPQILTRVAYVFADFAACETDILEAASKLAKPIDISVLSSCLENDKVKADRSVAAMIIQVIANLSVDAECSAILCQSDTIVRGFEKSTFGADDRLGFNLLSAASNFTYHVRTWCPRELIAAIPMAIVSKHIPSILESLRTLCNLGLVSNAMLINSKIPEILIILLKHVHPDVVLFSLQTLANLANHEDIRQRFQNTSFLNSVLNLLAAEEMDELHLEAIAALLMNFGDLSADEATLFARALADYELDDSNPVITAFVDFLNGG